MPNKCEFIISLTGCLHEKRFLLCFHAAFELMTLVYCRNFWCYGYGNDISDHSNITETEIEDFRKETTNICLRNVSVGRV